MSKCESAKRFRKLALSIEGSRRFETKRALHDLVLCQAAGVLGTFHGFAVALVCVLDVGQSERPAAILVAGEFC